MPKEFSRTERLAHLIQRELALIIQREVKDPRLGMVTVSDVKITKDLAYAKIYVTVFGDEGTIKANLQLLNRASGFMRSQLAARIKIRKMPELSFIYDTSLAEGERMDALIKKAIEDDERFKQSINKNEDEDENKTEDGIERDE